MAARQEAAPRRSARVLARLPVLCAVLVADGAAGSARRRGPAPALFPGAFLIPPPLVPRT
ncbi:hypothetical protein ACPA54_05545 [Uniformispora flossi]|uniref:hypothetical protein n=1 Tax=Uniformispora flossi TaxID=3390723 RepID=UPI003C2DFE26